MKCHNEKPIFQKTSLHIFSVLSDIKTPYIEVVIPEWNPSLPIPIFKEDVSSLLWNDLKENIEIWASVNICAKCMKDLKLSYLELPNQKSS